LPAVSFPSSVVRSIIAMASLRPATLVAFLIDRFANEAARSSSATASTAGGAKSAYIEPPLGRCPTPVLKRLPVFPFCAAEPPFS